MLARLSPLLLLIAAYGTSMIEKTSRLYWPYTLSSFAIAGLVFILYESRQAREEPLPGLGNYLFSRDIWLHRSAIQDYALFLLNYYVFLAFSNHFIFNPQNAASCFRLLFGLIFKIAQWMHIPRYTGNAGPAATVLFIFFSFMLAELFLYIGHRTMHRIPVLWQFHKIHHSSEVMTPLTYVRAHPVEVWIVTLVRTLAVGISSGIFYYLYGGKGNLLTIAEVDIGLFLFYFFGANLQHSHIWLTYGRKLEHVLISPAQHQIHHSNNPRHYDKNFGSIIALWDWMFGTLYLIQGREKITFGLTGAEREHCNSLWNLYIHPLKYVWKAIK